MVQINKIAAAVHGGDPAAFGKAVDANTKRWDEWEPLVAELPLGVHTLKVAEKGPIAVYTTHFSDQEFMFKTPDGKVYVLAEYMFEPFISRYDVQEGCVIQVTVSMGQSQYSRRKKLEKIYKAKIINGE